MVSRRFASSLLAAAVAVCVAPHAFAAAPTDEASDQRVFYQNLSAFRYNPVGLTNALELDWRQKLYDPQGSRLLQNNFAGLFLAPIFSPVSTRLGAGVKVRPLNILKVEARWEYLGYFGNINLMPSFDSPHADFSDSAVEALGQRGDNYATDGWQLTLDAELRAKVGPIVARVRFKAMYVDVALEGGDTVWYDQYYDLLLPAAGWFFLNDADLLWQLTPRLIVGLRYALGLVRYPDSAFAAGEATDVDNDTHRLGPLIALRLFDEPGAAFNQPTILLLVGWYLKHPWRTGQDVDQAIPQVAIGFAFNGDLL